MKDDFGDRMKAYEKAFTNASISGEWIYVRIDGRGFSKFTKDMERPYDARMSKAMQNTTKILMEKTGAVLGYTQSDEISLLFRNMNMFSGKIQKICSVFSGLATSAFIVSLIENDLAYKIYEMPHFDCRIFNLPSKIEAANAILWRKHDATKNAISMAARSVFSHKILHTKSGSEMIEMMKEKEVFFDHFPPFFKFGTTYIKVAVSEMIPDEVWDKIPVHKRLDRVVIRNKIAEIEIADFRFKDLFGVIGE